MTTELLTDYHEENRNNKENPIECLLNETGLSIDDYTIGWFDKEPGLKRMDVMINSTKISTINNSDKPTDIGLQNMSNLSVIHLSGFSGIKLLAEYFESKYKETVKKHEDSDNRVSRTAKGLRTDKLAEMERFKHASYKSKQIDDDEFNSFFDR